MIVYVFYFRSNSLYIIYDIPKDNHIGLLRLIKNGRLKRLTINKAYIFYKTYLHNRCNTIQGAKLKIFEYNNLEDLLWQYTISCPDFKMS